MQESLYSHTFEAPLLDGAVQPLAAYRGKVLLIVNVASLCGLSPQYAGLEALYRRYHERGLVVLGFPSNDFAQELSDPAEIAQFCSRKYDVTFPIFAKIAVNGAGTHPLFAFLKRQQKGFLGSEPIKWNFTKFLVDREGLVLRRYAPTETPEQIEGEVAELVNEVYQPGS
ncbi:glutathione peroxidase [Oscillochloris sp. ZM17-4]|uniref:glutathione peroxidase n=1 Tax=Oscillochloris sp. ZM17-4 TaxID=2866714 RepID=UPI001C7300A2|nr:glutathione peroxidase [Oscillochloris sp. ZM17-4]MBX0327913.1 glutathione peroxidase [Oscillochloris sp. ZM17-4]